MTGTTTTNFGFYKPAVGETGWGTLVNDNVDDIDRRLHPLNAAIMFAHPSGSNSNDGLSWATAKKDGISCYDALPSGGGTIVVAHQTYWDSVNTTRGIWIAGSLDSAYASLPAGWRQYKRCRIVGFGAGAGSFGRFGITAPILFAGSTSDTTKPALWLSDVDGFSMENIDLNASNSAQAIMIGKDSTDGTTSNTRQLDFRRVLARTAQTAGLGPTVDIKAGFWVWFQECSFAANEQELNTSDKRANILIEGSGEGGGLIFWKDSYTLGGGGLKLNSLGTGQPGSTNIIADTVTQEGTTTLGALGAPVVWVNTDQINAGGGHVLCRSIEASDRVAGSDPTVKVDAGVNPDAVILDGVTDWSGPCRVIGAYSNKSALRTTSVAGDRGTGFVGRTVFASHEGHRRTGGFAAALFTNNAAQDTSTWASKSGSSTVTTGKADPHGGTGAARLSSGSAANRKVASFNQTIAVGDWILGGCWVRTVAAVRTSGDVEVSSVNSNNVLTYSGVSATRSSSPFLDNAWHWVWTADKFATVGQAATTLDMSLRSESGASMDYYLPVMLYVPTASALSDSEMQEIAMNLQAFSDTASVGQLSIARDQSLHIPRGYIEVGTMTAPGAPTAASGLARLYVDTSGGKQRLVCIFDSGAAQVIATEP